MDETQTHTSETQEAPTTSAVAHREPQPHSPRPGSTGQATETKPVKRGFVWALAAVAIAALLLSVFSLAVNVFLVGELLAAQQAGREILDAAIAALDEFTLGQFAFSYTFSDTIVYSGTFPVSQTVLFPFQGRVPFQGNVPFQGTVPVAINVPLLGRQTFRVPINTNVYVDTAVDVSTTVTVPVQMDFPFAVEMPVQIPIDLELPLDDQPQLTGSLELIRALLIDIRRQMLDRAPAWRLPEWRSLFRQAP